MDEASTSPLLGALADRLPGLRLRCEGSEDLDFLQQLYAAVRAAELAQTGWTNTQKRAFTDAQFALQHRHYTDNYRGAEMLVIERDGARIGRVCVCPFPAEIRLMDIALVEDHRGRGIGSSLLRAIIDIARDRAVALTLHVEPENPAQRLYRRIGFRLIERRGIYDFLSLQATPETSTAPVANPSS